MRSFVHLHVHTEYSMLDGAAKVGLLMDEVSRQGMPAVAMSDHGNVHGAYEFHQAARRAGVKPIIGIEAYVAPGSRHHRRPVYYSDNLALRRSNDDTGEGGDVSGRGLYTHLTMWAADARGLRNLFRLQSRAWLEGHVQKYPRMDDELLAEYGTGLIATTGCPSGEVQTRLRLGQYEQAVEAAARHRDLFGPENYYLELMDHGLPIERRVREDLLRLGRRLALPPLATNDSHYVTEDQAAAHDALLCVGTGKRLADADRFRFSGSGYFIRPAARMRELWDAEVPGACDNTLLIAERVGDYGEVFAHRDLTPRFPVPEGETESSWLRGQTLAGARRRYGGDPPREVLDRIDHELSVIDAMGFPGYFLVVADICRYAREQGIGLGPGRGSATGSMVAYCTGITQLDPIEHQLIFERFLNPERITMPDVDLDFDDRRRDEMIDYVTRKYGDDRVCQIVTFSTIKAKAAVKDSCRVLGLPYAVGDRITKAFPAAAGGKEIPLSAIHDGSHPRYGEAAELRAMYEQDPDVRRVIDTATGIEGLTRGTGVHAAGVILSSEPLIDVIPLVKPKAGGPVITGFPFTQAEDMGLLKMDFLGLRNLTVIGDAIANVRANKGVEIDIFEVPLDDARTYELLARGDTLGVFQLDSGGMRVLLRLMQPTTFTDIAAVNALYRPGPMEMNAHTNYALRKTGKQRVEPIHPELEQALEPILGDTYHLVVFQEQVMAIAQQLAGYSLGAADLLRRAMGKKKKEVLDAEWDRFSAGMRGRGFSAEAVKAVWDVLVPFSGYGFNKSHTAGYGLVSYWTAYLKANHPCEYLAALLTSVGDDKDKMAVYLSDCRRLGIKVLPPDVNASNLDFTAVGADIRFGLGAVRNVGANVVDAVVTTREAKGRYTGFDDFLAKVPPVVCNKRVIESLAKAGAFDGLGHHRKALVAVHEQAVDAVVDVKRNQAHGQDTLFGEAGQDGAFSIAVPEGEWDRPTLLAHEREMLGLYVSSHPLDGAERVLDAGRDTTIADLIASGRQDGTARISGIVSGLQRKVTKQGSPWAIVTLEDHDAAVECLIFPKTYALYGEALAEDRVLSVRGRINVRDETVSLYGEEIAVLDVSTGGAEQPVVISIQEGRLTPRVVREFKHILTAHPGRAPVHVHLHRGPAGHLLLDLVPFQVAPGPAFYGDIKALLGATAIGAGT
ncbi:DNA polymerase III subunit alpha [Nonomuraea gerenzanensis]|uniref:DNA polymerase III subunit alpha n=1 Tax=Nonomuraea gerenzanensis TaxID=93944 RepID=A0A1M4EDB9_9ACTN|nr:DNA polymerase III subunit alpha [Nonomuraea gerenzanensis]UBU08617.1 DNA polymerase III subunit alpha [Nonomuraea gerenzanensis]SBO96977.1 DNA polymerase III alpha subunit [Nonomuraea gerenzanensis]